MKPNHFRLYQAWASLYAHFSNESYDAVKYNLKANVKYSNFEQRNDKQLFKIAEKEFDNLAEFVGVFLSLIDDNRGKHIPHISEILEEYNNKSLYRKWKSRINNLQYTLSTELNEIVIEYPSFKEYWLNGAIPKGFKHWSGKRISTETVVQIDSVVPIFRQWDKSLPKILAENYIFFLTKYKKFIRIEPELIAKAIKNNYKGE